MSRRHKRGRHGKFDRGDGRPQPPQKTINCRSKHRRRVNTEVHDAIWSLGARDRTSRLSDGEFNSQVAREAGYMFRLSGSYFRDACGAIAGLFRALF